MSETLANYVFLPWLRRGLSSDVAVQQSNRNPLRIAFTANLKLSDANAEMNINPPVSQEIQFYGPGDIAGIDHRVVIRTEPKRNIGDFEPNYFPFLEFSEPDFPWRYTPVAQNGDRLTPWVTLIVLRATREKGMEPEFDTVSSDPAKSLPAIKVHKASASLPESLQDLSQSWAWAHVQITTDKTLATKDEVASELDSLLKTEPERVISRILCPRRLQPGFLYHAFLVPTFEAGRRAGLGEADFKKPDGTPLGLLDPAWTLNDDPVILPYYYKWEFRTGLRGDFEYLIRLLEPRKLDEKIGTRFIDCSKPGYSTPTLEVPTAEADKKHLLGLQGALKSLDTKPTEWPDATTDTVQDKLAELLNLPENQRKNQPAEPPLIVPPLYGCWHAAKSTVQVDGYISKWHDTLNLDPRHRTTAGFGTDVVQNQQEKLMAAAWKQIGAVNEANELLRQAQAGRAASERMHRKHLKNLPTGELLRLTSPVNSRVLIKPDNKSDSSERVTVKHYISKSPIPASAIDPAFRRIQRARGPMRKRQQSDSDQGRKDILARLNEGEVAAAGTAPNPTPGVGDISDGLRQASCFKGWMWKILKYVPRILVIIFVLILLALGAVNGPANLPFGNAFWTTAGALLVLAIYLVRRFGTPGYTADNLREEKLSSGYVNSAKPPSDFQAATGIPADHFKVFASAAQAFLNYKPVVKPPQRIDLRKVTASLVDALDPKKTFPNRLLKGRLVLKLPDLAGRPDPLDQIMAAPEFNQPMYEPLRDLSQDLLLPGLEHIPQNTIGLLENNQEFIEAYMVGLNHEMARELLWREYPTDQRGSYFRQFWDVRDIVPDSETLVSAEEQAKEKKGDEWDRLSDKERKIEIEACLQEQFRDIKPIHQWWKRQSGTKQMTKLGSNSNRPELDLTKEEKLVLLIRGDLLKKYPNTVIYASKSTWVPDENNSGIQVRRPLLDHKDENTRFPIFKGTLPPDITFLGFKLTESEAKGSVEPSDNNPGWFFVVEERVSESRFGMDVYLEGDPLPDNPAPSKWDDLSWAHIIKADALVESGYIDVTKASEASVNPDGLTWDSQAAQFSKITLQKPMRIAVHADDMIPEHETTS